MRNLLVGVLLIAVVAGAYVGCGPRARVAGKKVMDQIDTMLGKLNVQEEKVLGAYKELEDATGGLREKRIEAKVRLERLGVEKKELEETKSKAMADLKKLQEILLTKSEGSETVTYNDKEIPVASLTSLAENTMKRIKLVDTKLNTRIKTLTDAYTKSLSVLTKNEETSGAQLKKLKSQIEDIQAKKLALDAMKEASTITGAEESISDKFDALTKDVDDLMVDVDVQIATEIEKVDERAADMATLDVSLDELLDDKSDISGTLSDMEALLGGQ